MPIRQFLETDEIARLSAAFDAALTKLGLVDRDDPASVAVAKRIAAMHGAGRAPAPHRFSVEV